MTAYLAIPRLKGRIDLSNPVIYLGKKEIQQADKTNMPSSFFDAISSVKQDPSGKVIKEQCILRLNQGKYTIEDLHSTNGTYLGSTNLKHSPPVTMKDGDQIIIPVEEKGQLVQLILEFHSPIDNVSPSPTGSVPSISQGQLAQSPSGTEQFYDPGKSPTSTPEDAAQSPMYYDPTRAPTLPPDVSAFYDPNDPEGQSGSFIMVHQPIPLTAQCFDPTVATQLGLDLSMFYRMEKSERWHILIAFLLLVTMVYRTYINITGITALIYYLQYKFPVVSVQEIFLDPIPIAVIFGLNFLIHELAHLYSGKRLGFPARFCLAKKGIRLTLWAALLGLPFGLPGAAVVVGVDPNQDKDKMGIIKMAGQLSNNIVGYLFILVNVILAGTLPSLADILLQCGLISFMLGGFNLIPREFKGFSLDGQYIFRWKKTWFFFLVIMTLLGYAIAILLLT